MSTLSGVYRGASAPSVAHEVNPMDATTKAAPPEPPYLGRPLRVGPQEGLAPLYPGHTASRRWRLRHALGHAC